MAAFMNQAVSLGSLSGADRLLNLLPLLPPLLLLFADAAAELARAPDGGILVDENMQSMSVPGG
jgi:hypothetical protein